MRTSTRRNKDGTLVRYLQLVHNVYDPTTQTGKTKVLHSFGREDDLDRPAIDRLIGSLQRALATTAPIGDGVSLAAGGGTDLESVSSRALGATWALDGIWAQLDLPKTLTRLLAGSRRDEAAAARVERVLFALVAARAIDPASKLATAAWLGRRTWIGGLTDGPAAGTPAGADLVSDDECYRAMDALTEHAPAVEEAVFWGVSTLLDLEVDLLFFDTTSTYFEVDEADEPVLRDDRGVRVPDADDGPGVSGPDTGGEGAGSDASADQQEPAGRRVGFRTWGKSKDSRADLPQIVIGMAVTRAGIPVRVWSWPGTPPTPP